ncbi:MAG: DUF4440 domain-containing protein [Gemmatimonadaceae bacterium]
MPATRTYRADIERGAGAGSPGRDELATVPARDTSADRAAVKAAVAKHWNAINAMDSTTIISQHTPDLTVFGTEVAPRLSGRGSREATEAFMQIVRAWRPHWTVEELEIQMHGDVAVATFYLGGSVTRGDGRVDARRRRTTEIWVRQTDGSWKEAHHHDSVFTEL